MREPTDERVREVLEQNAHPLRHEDGSLWWAFGGGPYRKEPEALAITRACLQLDVPITDVLTTDTWVAFVERVARIEQRMGIS